MSEDKREYTTAILIIGDEILSGRTMDANTPWIAEQLNKRGIRLAEVRIVQDNKSDIMHAVSSLRSKYNYVLTAGGIGPTHDDITADAIAETFNIKLKENSEARKMLEEHYKTTDLNEARLKMALIPEGADLIDNSISGAPGFKIENVYVMAGVPLIMQTMLANFIDDLDGGDLVLSNTVTSDLSESQVAHSLSQLEKKYENVSVGSYPQYRGGTLGLSIVLRSTDIKALENCTNEIIEAIATLGGQAKSVNVR